MKTFNHFSLKKTLKKKFVFLGLAATIMALSACAPIFSQPKEEATSQKQSEISKIDNSTLATFNLNGKTANYSLQDGMHDYLKAVSGAQNLATNFIDLLIRNFFRSLVNLDGNSAQNTSYLVTNKLLGQMSSVETDVSRELITAENNVRKEHKDNPKELNAALQKIYDQYGGNAERYKIFKSLQKYRNYFIDDLLSDNYLNYNNQNSIDTDTLNKPENWSKLKFNNDSLTDPIAKIFSQFQQFLFDDWLAYTNPVPVININWKYAGKDVKDSANNEILSTIYDKSNLSLNGISLPESANYQFPAFDDVSNNSTNAGNKFKNFITNLATLTNQNDITSNIESYTDDTNSKWSVVSLADLGDNNDFTSQKTAAILQVYNTYNSDASPVNSLEYEKIDKDSLLKNFLGYDESTNAQNAIEISGTTLFKSGTNFTKDNKNPTSVFDLRQINQAKFAAGAESSPDATKKQTQWMLFKDNNGAHALTIDGVSNLAKNKNYFKQYLLWRGMQNKNNPNNNADGINYNLINDLRKYLANNFDAIILRYLITNFNSDNTEDPTKILTEANKQRLANNQLSLTNPSVTNTDVYDGRLNATSKLLFNGTYNPFWKNSTISINQNNKLVSLLTSLSELLNTEYFNNNLNKLRQNLTKSYQDLVAKEAFKVGDKYYANLNNGLAGKLPFLLSYKTESGASITNYQNYSQDNDGGYQALEVTYFLKTATTPPTGTTAPAATTGTAAVPAGTNDDGVAQNNEANAAEAIYQKYFQPGTLQKKYADYLNKLTDYFKQTFSTEFNAYDSEELKNQSKVLHFNVNKTHEVKMLIVKSIDQNMLEAIRIQSTQNGDLAQIIQQKILASDVVNNYFDYSTTEWKISDAQKPTDWSYSTSFVESFKQNYLLTFWKKTFIDAKSKQIFGGYDQSNKNDAKTKFTNLLQKIQYQNLYVDSDDGFNVIGDKLLNDFKTFLTINWLLKDNFINFRNYLQAYIGTSGAAGFVWINQNKKTNSLNTDFGKNAYGENNSNDYDFNTNPENIINSPYYLNKSFAATTNFNTADNNWSFAQIGKESSGVSDAKNTVGFRGLLKSSTADAATNAVVGNLLFNSFQSSNSTTDNKGVLYNWGSLKNLKQTIQNIRTFDRLTEITQSLSTAFPNIVFDNVNRITIRSPIADSPTITLSLNQRKNALLNILNGYNYRYRTESEQIFTKTVENIYDKVATSENHCADCTTYNDDSSQISTTAFEQFAGSVKNGISTSTNPYAIAESDNSFTNYVAYLQQINYNDVSSSENFKAFMSQISGDVFLQTLFQAAQEASVQDQAMFDFLHDGFEKIIVYDQSLKNHLDNSWSVAYTQK